MCINNNNKKLTYIVSEGSGYTYSISDMVEFLEENVKGDKFPSFASTDGAYDSETKGKLSLKVVSGKSYKVDFGYIKGRVAAIFVKEI